MKKNTFENDLNRLMEIAEKLDENTAGLDDALKLYKEGLALSKKCAETLSKYENEVVMIQKEFNENT